MAVGNCISGKPLQVKLIFEKKAPIQLPNTKYQKVVLLLFEVFSAMSFEMNH